MASEQVKELTKQLEQGVADIFASEKYAEYLRVMSKFYMYSANNCLLIMLQKPEATQVAGYTTWKKVGRQVRKGEKAIKILAPCPMKAMRKNENGEDEETIVYTAFKTANVFDIAQTDGDALPEIATVLTGNVNDFDQLFDKIARCATVPVEVGKIDGGAHGYYSMAENKIVVKEGMSQCQTIKTLIHETTHSILHCADGEEKDADRITEEVEAESVAFVVCNALGIDSSDYSFGYVAGWSSDKEKKELKASMAIIQKTAEVLIKKILPA